MEAYDDAAKLRVINDAMEVVRRRSLRKRSWTIKEATDMPSWKWEQRRRIYRTVQANAGLAEVDPWHLPPRFAMPKEPGTGSSSLQTHSGYWKEKEDEFTAIRSEEGGEGSSSASSSPSYQGVRRTLEFYKHNGTKTDWVMHEYIDLDDDMFTQDDVVIRKVFNKKYTDPAEQQSLHRYYDMTMTPSFRSGMLYGNYGFLTETRVGCEEAESWSGEFPTASAGPDGESDDVWQHFTRINTKDPDVVYAACHRCDRVLKAHSKHHGTSPLRRHRKTKTCTCNNNTSSTTEDQEILRELRANLDLYKQGKMEGWDDSPELNPSVDPWDLPNPGYFTSSLSRKTHGGRWEEIKSNNKLIAIRIGQLPVPQYAGLKRTLQFHHHDNGTDESFIKNNGTGKGMWIMLEYHLVDEYNTHDLLLEGSMVFCKVIEICEELEKMWNGDEDEEDCYIGEREEEVKAHMNTLLRDCLLGEVVQGDQSRVGKRKRTGAPDGGSEVWLYFTKIRTADPDKVYAVCHSCDRGYKGHPKNGTSHLIRHNKRCSSKHPKV